MRMEHCTRLAVTAFKQFNQPQPVAAEGMASPACRSSTLALAIFGHMDKLAWSCHSTNSFDWANLSK